MGNWLKYKQIRSPSLSHTHTQRQMYYLSQRWRTTGRCSKALLSLSGLFTHFSRVVYTENCLRKSSSGAPGSAGTHVSRIKRQATGFRRCVVSRQSNSASSGKRNNKIRRCQMKESEIIHGPLWSRFACPLTAKGPHNARLEKQSAFKSELHLWQFCPHLGYYWVSLFQKLSVLVWVIMSLFNR